MSGSVSAAWPGFRKTAPSARLSASVVRSYKRVNSAAKLMRGQGQQRASMVIQQRSWNKP
jgi:hypothetical protein